METVILDAEWWEDGDGNPVPFGSERGVRVLHGVGTRVSADEAAALNALTPAQAKAVDAPPANKALKAAKETK